MIARRPQAAAQSFGRAASDVRHTIRHSMAQPATADTANSGGAPKRLLFKLTAECETKSGPPANSTFKAGVSSANGISQTSRPQAPRVQPCPNMNMANAPAKARPWSGRRLPSTLAA